MKLAGGLQDRMDKRAGHRVKRVMGDLFGREAELGFAFKLNFFESFRGRFFQLKAEIRKQSMKWTESPDWEPQCSPSGARRNLPLRRGRFHQTKSQTQGRRGTAQGDRREEDSKTIKNLRTPLWNILLPDIRFLSIF